MYYSSFGLLALILHVIINWEILKKGRKNAQSLPELRYYQFLVSLILFFAADILWGFFYESRIVFLAYADTVLFFISMVLSVLLWTRFVVAYLDTKGRFSTFLRYAGWAIFTYEILNLIINFFYPIVFKFEADGEYIPGQARYITLGIQFHLFLATSIYTFYIAKRSEGKQKIHHRAVAFSGLMMTIFIILQDIYPLLPCYAIGCLLGTCFIHIFVEEDVKSERDRELYYARNNAQREHMAKEAVQRESRIYNQIADSLSEDYDVIYYFNIESGRYIEYSPSEMYESMHVPKNYEDFYKDARENARRFAHPDDRDFAEDQYYKEAMLRNLQGRKTYSFKYRIMVKGQSRYFRFSLIRAEDGQHLILCEKDIHDIITAETANMEKQKKHVTFGQIAESLASNYDVIYYVDSKDGSYVGYTSKNIYGQFEVNREGDDFFAESLKNLQGIIHPKDKSRVFEILDKDRLLSALEDRKQVDIEYRLMIDGKPQYTRMSVRKSSDSEHFIVVVENIDEEVRKEREHLKALNSEKELARRDELTGTRNKMAYTELENSVQNNIDNGVDYFPFALAVCDINDLKKTNDTDGHKAGDELIKAAASLLCDIFDHSPVFRIGGDEFAIFLRGNDYHNREGLIKKLKEKVLENLEGGSGPVIAAGMSAFEQGRDRSVSEIFERADNLMYEDKSALKNR